MELENIETFKRKHNALPAPESMTDLDRKRQALTLAFARKMHKYTKEAPDAIDEDDIMVEREGWLSEDDLRAAAWVAMQDCTDFDRYIGFPKECELAALRRNVI